MRNFFKRQRTEHEEALIDAVIKSPLIDRILDEAEVENLDARRALLAQIAKLDSDRPAERDRLAEATVKAMRRFDAANLELNAAKKAYDIASMQQHGFENRYLRSRGELEYELGQGADPRLQTFIHHLTQLHDTHCVDALQFWTDPRPSYASKGAPRYFSNVEAVRAAKVKLMDVTARCRALQLQALSAVEVGEALGLMCIEVAPVLAAVDANPPCLTAANHDVGAPLKWGGTSRWVVDQLPEVIKDDLYLPPSITHRYLPPSITHARQQLAKMAGR